jgi:hypothetical protein
MTALCDDAMSVLSKPSNNDARGDNGTRFGRPAAMMLAQAGA